MNTTGDDNLIFHYCSTQSALSILKSQELWMTNIRNMNDSNETIGVYTLFFDLMRQHDKNNLLSEMYNVADMPGTIQLDENCLGAYAEHVVCFSKDPDSVSQWISYADDGHGLAIGFDEDRIISITSNNKSLSYSGITYVDKESVKSSIPIIYKNLIEDLNQGAWEMMFQAMKQIRSIYPLGIACKTWHYASENETRLIYKYNPDDSIVLPEGWGIKERQVFAKRNMINTCVPLEFPKDIIKKIVTGPKYQKNYFEMEFALYDLGYRNVTIQESTSGYR